MKKRTLLAVGGPLEEPTGLFGTTRIPDVRIPAGKDGKDGADGAQGLQGASVVDAEVDIDGTLLLTLSDGTIIKTSTEVVGSRGDIGLQGARGPSGITDDGIIYAFLFGEE
jgi:hypothetical protein